MPLLDYCHFKTVINYFVEHHFNVQITHQLLIIIKLSLALKLPIILYSRWAEE